MSQILYRQYNTENKHMYIQMKPIKHYFRAVLIIKLKVVQNSFQHLDLNRSSWPLFITWCYNDGINYPIIGEQVIIFIIQQVSRATVLHVPVIIWLCLSKTGCYQIHKFDWVKSIYWKQSRFFHLDQLHFADFLKTLLPCSCTK